MAGRLSGVALRYSNDNPPQKGGFCRVFVSGATYPVAGVALGELSKEGL